MNKTSSILLNVAAVIVCSAIGIMYLQDGRMGLAAFQFSLAVFNAATIIWLIKQK